jgi:hypothetical protein
MSKRLAILKNPKKDSARKSLKKRKRSSVRNWMQLARLRYEKCELAEARVAFAMALKAAQREGDIRMAMEAIAGLLRLAADALDEEAIRTWDHELDQLMQSHARQVPAMAWYCKSVIARRESKFRLAQAHMHRYLRIVRAKPKAHPKEAQARGWLMLSTILWQRGHLKRAQWVAEEVLRRYETQNLPGMNGLAAMVLGAIFESRRDCETAMAWYQRAHGSFLGEHNWYYHLYVLYGYARIHRQQQNYSQAHWHLDLVDKAASGPGFGLLQKEISDERKRLNQDAVDLLIDSRLCVIKTRESGEVSLGKQYVLLQILEALSSAHHRAGDDGERGLSKAEIIEKVWKEAYRPEAHDNKLYYNINRLRKLIEPDVRKPQYLLNWKEGYRLAPGLRVRFVGARPS